MRKRYKLRRTKAVLAYITAGTFLLTMYAVGPAKIEQPFELNVPGIESENKKTLRKRLVNRKEDLKYERYNRHRV